MSLKHTNAEILKSTDLQKPAEISPDALENSAGIATDGSSLQIMESRASAQ